MYNGEGHGASVRQGYFSAEAKVDDCQPSVLSDQHVARMGVGVKVSRLEELAEEALDPHWGQSVDDVFGGGGQLLSLHPLRHQDLPSRHLVVDFGNVDPTLHPGQQFVDEPSVIFETF